MCRADEIRSFPASGVLRNSAPFDGPLDDGAIDPIDVNDDEPLNRLSIPLVLLPNPIPSTPQSTLSLSLPSPSLSSLSLFLRPSIPPPSRLVKRSFPTR